MGTARPLGGRTLRAVLGGRLRGELRPLATLTFAEASARLLSFCFYLVVARILTTAEFGVVRYTIALSLLAFVGLQVIVTGLMRELGASRGDDGAAPTVIGSALAATLVVLAVSLAACLVAGLAGATGSASLPGLLVCLAGLAAFQLYYAVARGLGEPGRAVATYAGGSLAQLLISAGALAVRPTATVALVVFGLSCLVPIAVCEIRRPVLRRLGVSRAVLARLRSLAGPLLVAQLGFMTWLTADQVWVDQTLGDRELGVYGAAKTVSQLFIILPTGVVGWLLPRVAELRATGESAYARRLLFGAAGGLLLATLAVAGVVIAGRSDLLRLLFGSDYAAGAPALTGLALGMVAYAGFVGLTEGAVGWGRPRVYSAGIAVAAVAEVGLLLSLGSDAGASDAAWASAASMAAGLTTVVAILLVRPLRADAR